MINLRKALLYSFLVSLIFSYVLLQENRISDINLHSAAAHIGYKIIIEHDEALSQAFGVDLLKPASVFHVFYIFMYIFIKKSWLIAFIFHFLYFFFWGIASFFLLKQINKLFHSYFFAMLLLSLNPGVYFSMPAFMAAEVAYLFVLAFAIKKFNENNQNFLMYLIIPIVLLFHFLHPYVGIIAVLTLSFYTTLKKDAKFDFFKFVLISALGLFLLFIFSFVFIYQLGSSESSLLLIENLLNFLLQTFLTSKIPGVISILDILIFLVYLPLITYFMSVKKYSIHIKMFYIIAILFVILPDDFGNAFNMSGRLIFFAFLFLLLGSEDDKFGLKILFFISIICMFFSLIYFFYGEQLSREVNDFFIIKDFLSFFNKNKVIPYSEDPQLYEQLSQLNTSRVYFILVNNYYGTKFDDIDKNIISSSIYTFSSHPVYPKIAPPFYEYSNLLKGSSENETNINEKICEILKEKTKKICSFYEYVVSEKCTLDLKELPYSILSSNPAIRIYKC